MPGLTRAKARAVCRWRAAVSGQAVCRGPTRGAEAARRAAHAAAVGAARRLPSLLASGSCGRTRCASFARSAQTCGRKSDKRSALRAPTPRLRGSAPQKSPHAEQPRPRALGLGTPLGPIRRHASGRRPAPLQATWSVRAAEVRTYARRKHRGLRFAGLVRCSSGSRQRVGWAVGSPRPKRVAPPLRIGVPSGWAPSRPDALLPGQARRRGCAGCGDFCGAEPRSLGVGARSALRFSDLRPHV